MPSKSSEALCDAFFEEQLVWVRDYLLGRPFSTEAMRRLTEPGGFEKLLDAQERYEELLGNCPVRLREYRNRRLREARKKVLESLPSLRKGAPRKDGLATEAAEMRQKKMSYGRIAIELNRKYGKGTTTPQAVYRLISRRKHPSS